MVDKVSPNPPSSPNDPKVDHYKGQYKVSPEFRQFWQQLFKNTPLTDDQVQKMTDQFIKSVWDQMNKVLQHYLANMKKLERQRKENED